MAAREQRGSTAPGMLLHGFGDSPECWSPLLAALDDDVDITTPAAPGHAGEPAPSDDALQLDYLAEVAKRHAASAVARAGRKIVLGGHSMGAATATAVAAQRPDLVCALYLEDPPWGWPPSDEPDPGAEQYTGELAEWIAGLQQSDHEDRVDWCLTHNPGWPRDEYDIWARAKAEVDPAVFDATIDLGRYAWQPLAEAVRCPVTLLVGSPDRGSTCDPEVADYLASLPGWTVIRLPDAGHDLRRENRAAAVAALTDLLHTAAQCEG